MSSPSPTCFHCGLPLPTHTTITLIVQGAEQSFCCHGCKAVAEAILSAGLGDFYRHRTVPARRAEEVVPEALRTFALYDRPELQKGFVRTEAEHIREAALILEGITCAACVWLNERHVGRLPGVLSFAVNYTTHRATVRWDVRTIALSDILAAIAAIGYTAHPFDPARQEALSTQERRLALRRLAVAGIGSMQVMMLAVALYAGDYHGMETWTRDLLRWSCLALAIPVVCYAALPLFQAALRDLRAGQTGMDVPVSVAIGGAFVASVWYTLQGGGAVYYDSVTMFTFFLLAGRFVEMGARHRAAQISEALVRTLPATAVRLTPDGEEVIPIADLVPGDHVHMRPGAQIPADGVVITGVSTVDESLLTGESLPIPKHPGDRLIGGAVNVESPLVMRVEQVGADTLLSAMVRLLDRAQREKPRLAQLADRMAAHFTAAVLVIAVLVLCGWWWVADFDTAFGITLSVLVVTCPCALSLATPTALAAATGTLTQSGVLTTRGHALETLAQATHVAFDKTGTLTLGRLKMVRAIPLSSTGNFSCAATDHDFPACPDDRAKKPSDRAKTRTPLADDKGSLAENTGGLGAEQGVGRESPTIPYWIVIAAALERGSEHPISRAFTEVVDLASHALPDVTDIRNVPGAGIEGWIDGQCYRIGQADFVCALSGQPVPHPTVQAGAPYTTVFLGNVDGLWAQFDLSDTLRPDAQATVSALQARGITVWLLSGDQPAVVAHIAQQVGIRHAHGAQSPQDKWEKLRALQAQGAIVAMVGDGINDAPVLAAAQVSLAMGSGTQLAHVTADMVLLSEQLAVITHAINMAQRTRMIIWENLTWAIVYNLVALPLAISGYLSPWMSALGMSLSSLLVVFNARRLKKSHENGQHGITRPEK